MIVEGEDWEIIQRAVSYRNQSGSKGFIFAPRNAVGYPTDECERIHTSEDITLAHVNFKNNTEASRPRKFIRVVSYTVDPGHHEPSHIHLVSLDKLVGKAQEIIEESGLDRFLEMGQDAEGVWGLQARKGYTFETEISRPKIPATT